VRLCGDSPLLDTTLLDALLDNLNNSKYDLISNVSGRKFPKGQSVEIAKSEVFLKVKDDLLTAYEREHVMPYFYHNKSHYNALFFEYEEDLSHINMCVDTLEDLKSIEKESYSYNFDRRKLCITPS
jgi:spore coat polysaccharide biosynthesis protein SpsF